MATLKQKTAAKNLLENPGKPIGQAMLEAGYDEATAKNPKDLTDSKGFQEIMTKAGITDQKLAKVLHDGLDAKKSVWAGQGDDKDVVEVADHPTRHKYLETGLKLKGLMQQGDQTQIFQFVKVVNNQKGGYNI